MSATRFQAIIRDGHWCVVDSYSDEWVVAVSFGHDEAEDMEWAVRHASELSEAYAEYEPTAPGGSH